ncbi:hypothetical protein [Brasilonema sp. UFV-L1]|uniref:hypothetical protein n=1 Tax=Brasilonema sp. UFV-L1 TaxID=2234130 RepID=UPI00145E43A8|nr:hypothetical protein [Brasilonema sp. UFV-L1]NMG11118.1 hypothetical protein [Brasilonema sp. UFV-L1]
MEPRGSFFGILGQIIQNSVRYLIRLGRKYQIVAAAYLVIFCTTCISLGNQKVSPPPAPTTPGTTPSEPPVPNPPYAPSPSPETNPASPSPTRSAIDVAQVKAYKSGNFLTIRFDKSVADVQLSVDNQSVSLNCAAKICTATLPEEVSQIQVSWSQGGENFSTKFRL